MSFTILPKSLSFDLIRTESGSRDQTISYIVREKDGSEYRATHYWTTVFKNRHGAYKVKSASPSEKLLAATCYEKLFHKMALNAKEQKEFKSCHWGRGTLSKGLVKKAPATAKNAMPVAPPPAASTQLIAQNKALQELLKVTSAKLANLDKSLTSMQSETLKLKAEIAAARAEEIKLQQELKKFGF